MGWLDLLVGSLRAWALLSALGILPCHVMALDNGLARTPAMGYNTWNSFGGNSTTLPLSTTKLSNFSWSTVAFGMDYGIFNVRDGLWYRYMG